MKYLSPVLEHKLRQIETGLCIKYSVGKEIRNIVCNPAMVGGVKVFVSVNYNSVIVDSFLKELTENKKGSSIIMKYFGYDIDAFSYFLRRRYRNEPVIILSITSIYY